jgi:hypothetical protein
MESVEILTLLEKIVELKLSVDTIEITHRVGEMESRLTVTMKDKET